MKTYQDLIFEEISEEDISILTPIMKRAFDEDARIHLGKECGGPPGYDNGDFLRKYALHKDSTAFKISMNGRVIGAIILWIDNSTKHNFLGNIFIDVDLQNKGICKRVWEFVEHEFPDTKVWRTETPIFSHRNHNFYVNKCGFHIIKIENPKDLINGNFIFEKVML
jgi:hypothetical protein